MSIESNIYAKPEPKNQNIGRSLISHLLCLGEGERRDNPVVLCRAVADGLEHNEERGVIERDYGGIKVAVPDEKTIAAYDTRVQVFTNDNHDIFLIDGDASVRPNTENSEEATRVKYILIYGNALTVEIEDAIADVTGTIDTADSGESGEIKAGGDIKNTKGDSGRTIPNDEHLAYLDLYNYALLPVIL